MPEVERWKLFLITPELEVTELGIDGNNLPTVINAEDDEVYQLIYMAADRGYAIYEGVKHGQEKAVARPVS